MSRNNIDDELSLAGDMVVDGGTSTSYGLCDGAGDANVGGRNENVPDLAFSDEEGMEQQAMMIMDIELEPHVETTSERLFSPYPIVVNTCCPVLGR